MLKRDFGVVDYDSALIELNRFFSRLHIVSNNEANKSLSDSDLFEGEAFKINASDNDTLTTEVKAFLTGIISHIIVTSTDVGYLEKDEAMIYIIKVNNFAKEQFNGFHSYGDLLLVGDLQVALNKGLGRKTLVKCVEDLKNRIGSPWNNVKWE